MSEVKFTYLLNSNYPILYEDPIALCSVYIYSIYVVHLQKLVQCSFSFIALLYTYNNILCMCTLYILYVLEHPKLQ